MKYLLLLLVVLGCLWWLRRARAPGAQASAAPGKRPVNMVQCANCGVHLPENDAKRGQRGMYCSDAHCQQSEGRA